MVETDHTAPNRDPEPTMQVRTLPPLDEMYSAFLGRDASYDGIFYTGVRTTGIFCLPSCPARKPHRENVVFFRSAREAMFDGFRPCKRCRPLARPAEAPQQVLSVVEELTADPSIRLRDGDLRRRGIDPVFLRRWFKRHHDMTFHAYQRALRLGPALREIADGRSVTESAFESGYESLSGFEEAVRKLTGDAPTAARDGEIVSLLRIDTPLGPMLAGTTKDSVCLLEFTDRRMLETQLKQLRRHFKATFVPGVTDLGRQLEDELSRYFEGTLRDFTVPLVTPGTPFQEKVWAALRDVPYGETRSYGAQAKAMDNPNAVRAVARANGENRIAIIIPCHRIIGSDGSLTGYGGGIWRKQWLLEHELEHMG